MSAVQWLRKYNASKVIETKVTPERWGGRERCRDVGAGRDLNRLTVWKKVAAVRVQALVLEQFSHGGLFTPCVDSKVQPAFHSPGFASIDSANRMKHVPKQN